MIGKLTGVVGYRATDHVLVEVGGVGYVARYPTTNTVITPFGVLTVKTRGFFAVKRATGPKVAF